MDDEVSLVNATIETPAPDIYALLSALGKRAYYPNLGVTQQNLDARGSKINAVRGQAFDNSGQPMVLECMLRAAASLSGKSFLYSPPHGNHQLREAWKQRLLQQNPGLDAANVCLPVITNGLTQGLSIAGQLFLDIGESLITPDLFWENYTHTFRDRTMITFPFYDKDKFNVGELEKILEQPGKYFIQLAFPSNPSGYALTNDEVIDLTEVILNSANKGSKVVACLDDAYISLLHDERCYRYSLFNKLASLHERVLAVKVDGATKELYAWGLRVGAITFGSRGMTSAVAKALEDKAASIVRGDTSAVPTPSQEIVLTALRDPNLEPELKEKNGILLVRYHAVKEILELGHQSNFEFFEPLPFNSGYFVSLGLKKVDADKIRKVLLAEYSTGVLFFPPNHLRISHPSVSTGNLQPLFDNIYSACKKG